jgi:hypothetical protein
LRAGFTPIGRGAMRSKSGMDAKAYAKSIERPHTTIHDEVKAARVAQAADTHVRIDGDFKTLVEVPATLRWLWARSPPLWPRASGFPNRQISESICALG